MHMTIEQIPILVVSYNSPDLIATLLSTLRRHYDNQVYIIDGSTDALIEAIRSVSLQYDNVEFISFGYNIHHCPGMSWAITNLPLSGKVLVLDSDVEIINAGFIESLDSYLLDYHYGVGGIQQVNEAGFDRPEDGEIAYLHPSCMLCNLDVMKQWPLPIKHGAPMIQTMLALHKAGAADLIRHIDWVKNDNTPGSTKVFIKHDWQGTVIRTGSYHYDAPSSQEFNSDLLAMIPLNAQKLTEIGCGDGALARAYRTLHPICNYTGVEISSIAANAARAHCDFVFNLDIEILSDDFFADAAKTDCWILDDVLANIRNPWDLLEKIRKVMPTNGTLVISIPNMQHWIVQARLNLGDLRYENEGLLDRAHVRWFTRGTILEMLQSAGFGIVGGTQIIKEESGREKFLPAIRMMAQLTGNDPDIAVADATAIGYIVQAVPI